MFLFNKSKFNLKEAISKNLEYVASSKLDVCDIQKQFTKSDSIDILKIENVIFPTGNIVISDAISNLPYNRYSPILDESILSGNYDLEVSLIKSKNISLRTCAIRLIIKKDETVKYERANYLEETKVKNGKIYGIPINEGMICICDARDALEYQNYVSNWHMKNRNKNFYEDYLKRFFSKNYNGFNYIEWINPSSKDKLLIFPSSFKESFYQVFIGYDDNNEISEIIIPMLNPNLFE